MRQRFLWAVDWCVAIAALPFAVGFFVCMGVLVLLGSASRAVERWEGTE